MLAATYLLLALLLGASFTRWLGLSLGRIEAAAMAIATGLFGFTWIMLLPCLILPYRWALPLGCILVLGLSGWLWRAGISVAPRRLKPAAHLGWTVVALAAALFWTSLMFGHDLKPSQGMLISAGSTWADFGLHVSLISHQALASKLPLDLPLASGTSLTYPFLIDFLSALFVRGGWDFNLALAIPGTLLAWSITQLLIAFGWRLYGRFGIGLTGALLTLTGGSFAGLAAAWNNWHASHLSLSTWLHHVPQDFTGIDAINVHFNNAVADLLLPQRAFLFGLSIWLVIAILWHAALTHQRRRWLYAGAILMGLLPMAHPHSFVAAATLFAGLAIWVWLRDRDHFGPWLIAAGIIFGLTLPQLAWQFLAATNSGTGGHVTAGWDRMPGEALLGFEWRNFGFLLPVLGAITAFVWRRPWRRYIPWLVPFMALFIAAQLYSLQPFAYDNLKLLFYVYLVATFALSGVIWSLQPWFRAAAIVAAVLVFSIPGTLSIVREYQLSYQFASRDDLALGNWAKANTPLNTVFATTDMPNQPLATIGGRRIVLGYRGWLYNYHLDYSGRESAIGALLEGNLTDSSIKPFHPDYLAVSIYDSANWTVNQSALASLPLAYQNATWAVYLLPYNH